MREIITIETPSLGDRSYIVHDGVVGIVVDPQRDVDRFIAAIDAIGVDVTHVLETHLHEDYASGALVLARKLRASYVNAAAESLAVDYDGVDDGDRIDVGSLTVEVRRTPGHTPNHLSYVVNADGVAPAVFTGGFLLYGTVGRTDLAGDDSTEQLAREQFRSAHELAASLPDETEIYPTHGFGSFCAAVKSDGDSDGTLGTERKVNVALTTDNEDEFVRKLLASLMPHPSYYDRTGRLNRAGPIPVDLTLAPTVDRADIAHRVERGEWVVDVRARTTFAAAHLEGTVGIELDDPFATYLGWLVPWGTDITLLGESTDQILDAQRQLVRIGIDRPSGAVSGGLAAWNDPNASSSYPVVDFYEVADAMSGDLLILDVRRADEYEDGHIDGATNLPLHELLDRADELPDAELWVHCASGYRASIAASLLDRMQRRVVLIDDDFAHASDASIPMATDNAQT